jgi:hypothetical protein
MEINAIDMQNNMTSKMSAGHSEECPITQPVLQPQARAQKERALKRGLEPTNSHQRHPSAHKVSVPSDGIREALPQPSLVKEYEGECECETIDEPQIHPNVIDASLVTADTIFQS